MKESLGFVLKNLPHLPGVYQFYDDSGQVIYVGKSLNLYKRVNSYFDRKHDSLKTVALVEKIVKIEYTITQTETEALILECNLIKQYSPRYNILFKDGKSYPYIKLHVQAPWPWIEKVRILKKDGAKYYGPFVNEWKVNRILDYIDRHFRLIKCNQIWNDLSGRPCIDYQINRCDGPCFQKLSSGVYENELEQVKKLLDGRITQFRKELTVRMQECAKALEFEKAAKIRDQIQAMSIFQDAQDADGRLLSDEDHVAIATLDSFYMIQHMMVRGGKIIDQIKIGGEMEQNEAEEILIEYLKRHYLQIQDPPLVVCTHAEIRNHKGSKDLKTVLKGAFSRQIVWETPEIGRKRRLLDLCSSNALEFLRVSLLRDQKNVATLTEMQVTLGLKNTPYRIECFDISNLQGNFPVASMVVCEHGKMNPRAYRKFKIRCKSTPDDFMMMREVLHRRYSRLIAERKALPDLIIVDGGIGQLHAAAFVLEALGIARDVDLASLAKKEEIIFVSGIATGFQLGKYSNIRLLFQKIRDEAHRFAITFHRNLRDKSALGSLLDNVEGIGAQRKFLILKHFPDLKELLVDGLEKLKRISIPEKVAKNLIQTLLDAAKI